MKKTGIGFVSKQTCCFLNNFIATFRSSFCSLSSLEVFLHIHCSWIVLQNLDSLPFLIMQSNLLLTELTTLKFKFNFFSLSPMLFVVLLMYGTMKLVFVSVLSFLFSMVEIILFLILCILLCISLFLKNFWDNYC